MVLLSTQAPKKRENRFVSEFSSLALTSVFQDKRVRFSGARAGKYVQQYLQPASKRVGTKLEHRGFCGLYSVSILALGNRIQWALDRVES